MWNACVRQPPLRKHNSLVRDLGDGWQSVSPCRLLAALTAVDCANQQNRENDFDEKEWQQAGEPGPQERCPRFFKNRPCCRFGQQTLQIVETNSVVG